MRISSKAHAIFRPLNLVLSLLIALLCAQCMLAQAPKPDRGPMPKMPLQIKPDPRVQQRKYHFAETNEDLSYVLYVSSKVTKDKKNPLIVALHGMGGDGNFLVRERLVDLAEEGGYIVVGPLGYNVTGWYGSPVIVMGGRPIEPPNLAELSEKDVMTVFDMMRKEFNIDDKRTYLLGHSMGGAGTFFLGSKYPSNWAAIASIAPAAFLMQKDQKNYLGKLKNADIPVMLVQGGADTVVPPENTRTWSDAMKEMAMKYEYVELPNGDHGTVISDGMPGIFKFFADHPKASVAQSLTQCSEMTKFKLPGVQLEITKAAWVPTGPAPAMGPGGTGGGITLPAHCRVDGMIDRRTGAGGSTYGIGFAVSLPENWNGRFLQQGGGGLNGTVAEPLGGVGAGNKPALLRGFAVATTDTGHQAKGGGGFDAGFMQDQQALIDFEYAAIGKVAVIAKQIVEAYYAKPPARSYFAGCSTGGREAMLMTQRYPLYFDGVIAGAPAMRTGLSNLADRTVSVALSRIAPKGADGKPVPGGGLSDTDRKIIISKLLEACDALDGAKDGMIFDMLGCGFDPASLMCKGPKTEGCLSQPQVTALKEGFAGPKDSRGNQVYPGFFFDTGITASGQGIPGLIASGPSPLGNVNSGTEQNIDKEAAAADANPGSRLGDSAYWTNLNTFSSHGGKLLFYHGVSDPWFSAKDTIGYYERLMEANGGPGQVKNWSRLFLAPGMGHCSGGSAALDSFDLLSALVDWVEKGTAPDSVRATGRAFPDRSRPLCPFPAHAQYKGQGDPEDAANFECK